MGKNLPANTGDKGSVPGPGGSQLLQSNYAHVPQLLSLCAAATEVCMPRAHAPQQEKATAGRSLHPAKMSSPY